ncbi:MAG TPA: TetR/AcrR family transcriptional regulator [Acidimicrobiales bacterium]|jgi:AcrR family transcriptional regulator|nr:TetR/AcrR family transcriptional regulator [Acidimicrobiales bacterium]
MSSPDDAAGPPSLRARKKRRTRDRIYDAALALFAERHYDEVTVDAICVRAEVGRATFFRFYGSKAGLLDEFSRRLAEQIARRLDDLRDATATEQLWAVQDEITTAWGLSAPSTREMAREYIRNATAADLSDAAPAELVALVADVVRDGQASGEFTRGYEPDFVAWIILAALSAITAGWLGTGDDDSLVRGTHDTVAFLLHGLTGPSGPSGSTGSTGPSSDPR